MNCQRLLLIYSIFVYGILFNFNALAINQQTALNPGSTNLVHCLGQSLKKQSTLERDRSRMDCVYKFKNSISPTECSKIARTLEYSNFEDELKLFCMSELTRKINFHQCFQVASSMNYIDNSENAKWNCIKKFERNLNYSDCKNAARQMKFSYNKNKILSYCDDELKYKK